MSGDGMARGWPREYTGAALLLTKAADFAAAEGRSVWDFAVELEDLLHAGLTKADLRWLICRGWVEQAEELVRGGGRERVFRAGGLLTIGRRACFVLTDVGRVAMRQQSSTCGSPVTSSVPPAPGVISPAHVSPHSGAGEDSSSSGNGLAGGNGNGEASKGVTRTAERDESSSQAVFDNGHSRPGNGKLNGDRQDANGNGHARLGLSQLKPVWDADLNRLTLGEIVVKEYRTPAPNQQRILAAFQEENWPVRIDDPLPPHPDQEPKRRLHETIVSLNRNQRSSLLRFCGDGNGEGVRWVLS